MYPKILRASFFYANLNRKNTRIELQNSIKSSGVHVSACSYEIDLFFWITFSSIHYYRVLVSVLFPSRFGQKVRKELGRRLSFHPLVIGYREILYFYCSGPKFAQVLYQERKRRQKIWNKWIIMIPFCVSVCPLGLTDYFNV